MEQVASISEFLANHPEVSAVLVSKVPTQSETATAFRVLQYSLMLDPEYAWSWHCNIAMAFYDEARRSKEVFKDGGTINLHEVSNRAAARFMKLCFDVDVTQSPQWKSLTLTEAA